MLMSMEIAIIIVVGVFMILGITLMNIMITIIIMVGCSWIW